MIYQCAQDNNDETLFNDFPSELNYLLSKKLDNPIALEVSLNGKKAMLKLGYFSNTKGIIYTITTIERYINSSKLFKELIKMSEVTLNSIVVFKRKTSFDQNSYVQDLIHNLTSLNAYNIQSLFALIPQQVLTQNINKQHEVIKDAILNQPNITITTLLKLIKYNFAMKVEFSVFEKTVMQNPVMQKRQLQIRDIILSILQIFIDDFEKMKITVSLGSSEKTLNVDYDTLFVSLYYILENAVKYCAKSTDFKIIFKEEDDCFSVLFKMISVRIEDNEITKLCNKNFRASNAILLTDKGKGIGMNRILKTLKMNDATIEISPRVTDFSKTQNEISFDHNEFKIKFMGQQDWFKTNVS